MSRGVENFACVISLNRFETTSRGGFGESDSMVDVDAAKPVISDSIVAVRTSVYGHTCPCFLCVCVCFVIPFLLYFFAASVWFSFLYLK